MNGISCPPDTLYVCVHNPQCEYVVTQLKEHGYWGKFKVVVIHSISTRYGEFIPLDDTNTPISLPPVIVGAPTFLFFVNNQAKVLKGKRAILEHFKIEYSSNSNEQPMSKIIGASSEDGVKPKKIPFATTPPVILDNPASANITYTPIVPGVVYDKKTVDNPEFDPVAKVPGYGGMHVISQSEIKTEEMTKRLNEYNQKINKPLTYGN